MFCVANSKRIAKYVLLSLLYFDSVFSATIETVQRFEDDDVNYGEEDILRHDFFHFTTRKRYIWDDWTIPTFEPIDYGGSSQSAEILLYVFIPVFIVVFLVVFVYICLKNVQDKNCCSFESDSHSSISADIFTTVHRPPERRRDLTAQVHRPPTGTNQYSNSWRELGAPGFTGETISFINSTYVSSSQSRTAPDSIATERPPDYSTVALNDLINPTKPTFPVVRKGNESPPPEYSKGDPLFR